MIFHFLPKSKSKNRESRGVKNDNQSCKEGEEDYRGSKKSKSPEVLELIKLPAPGKRRRHGEAQDI